VQINYKKSFTTVQLRTDTQVTISKIIQQNDDNNEGIIM